MTIYAKSFIALDGNQRLTGGDHCPYVHPEPKEVRRMRMLRRYIPDVLPLVCKADWYCSGCASDYHGELYCLICRTGGPSYERCAE